MFHLMEGEVEDDVKGTTKAASTQEKVPAAVTELCSMEYIAAKFEAGRGHDLQVSPITS